MTQKAQIEQLEKRIEALEALQPKQHVQRHVSASQVTTRSKEETALPELTADEEAFLFKLGIPAEQQVIPLQLQQARTTSEDRRIIQSLRSKRALQLSWFQ